MAKSSSFSFQMSAHRESMRTCEGLFCHRASLTKSKFLVLKSVRSGLRYQLWPFLAKCTEPLFLALIKTIAGNYTSNAVFRVKIKNTQFSHVFIKDPQNKTKIDGQVISRILAYWLHNAVPTGAGAEGRGVPNCKGFLGNDVLPKRSKPTLFGTNIAHFPFLVKTKDVILLPWVVSFCIQN